MRKGPAVSDEPAGGSASGSDVAATTRIPRPAADDFQPDVPADDFQSDGATAEFGADVSRTEAIPGVPDETAEVPNGTAPMPVKSPSGTSGRPPADYGGDPTREPLAFDSAPRTADRDRHADEDVHLIPGATIANGRYRLLVFHGGPPNLQFWQALDTALDRQVALTFVDPDATLPDDGTAGDPDAHPAAEPPRHARRRAGARRDQHRFRRPGGLGVDPRRIAGRGGRDLAVPDRRRARHPVAGRGGRGRAPVGRRAVDRPSQPGAGQHRGRRRARLPRDAARRTPEDDIRGIGAALYALLINRWPLPESGEPSGLAPAELDAAGQPVEPRAVDRDIPFQISAAAARAVQEGGGIRSAPTLLNLLQQATAIADRTEHIAPVDEPEAPPPARVRGGLRPDDPERRPAPQEGPDHRAGRRRRRHRRRAGRAGDGAEPDLRRRRRRPRRRPTGPQLPLLVVRASPPVRPVIKPIRATVFSPEGEADAPDLAGLAIDGNPATVWPTDTYSDPAPFPNFKNGVGLMLQLPQPTTLGSVTINVNSTGTAVQIRSSPTPTPSSLDDTTALTPPTPLKPGSNTIEVDNASPTSNVLVWVSTLGPVNGESRSDISEITLKAAS